MTAPSPETIRALVKPVAQHVGTHAFDASLETELNRAFPAASAAFRAIEQACHAGVAAGWLCTQGGGNRRFGRLFEPDAALAGLSVDVVDITDLVGNHHRHPTGEIDLIMPVTPGAKFDGRGAGWLVYAPGSAHRPTVTGGRALILYLLPQGRIEWTSPA